MAEALSAEEIERGIKGLLFNNKSESSPSTSTAKVAASDNKNKSLNVSTPNCPSPQSASQRKREKAKLRKLRKQDRAKALSESEANERKQDISRVQNSVGQSPVIQLGKDANSSLITKNDEAVQKSRRQRKRDKAITLSESETSETKQDGSHFQNSVGQSSAIRSGNDANPSLVTKNDGALQKWSGTPSNDQRKKSKDKQRHSSAEQTPDIPLGRVDGSNPLDMVDGSKLSENYSKVQTIYSKDNKDNSSVEGTPDSHRGIDSSSSSSSVSNTSSKRQQGNFSSNSSQESKSKSVDQDKHGAAKEGVKEILKKEEKKLEEHSIFPLKKKSDKFPKAKYFCRLCDYHCDDVQHCMKHIKDTRHCRLKQLRDEDKLLQCLPYPTLAHISAVNDVVMNIFPLAALEPAELDKRWQAISRVQEVITAKLPELRLLPYGSTVTGFGLKSSDINLDIVYPSGHSPAQVLISCLEALQESDVFTSVHSDFSAKYPSITVIVDKLECLLGVDNSMACETSQLLETYSKIDPRVLQLGVVFRHWAKLCKIDSQEDGTLPAHSFGLMTVYFLQQIKPPILPCLHGIPLLNDASSRGKMQDYFKDINNLSKVWRTTNEMCLGELWINLLKFYSVDFNMADDIVSIRQPGLLLKKDKKWGSKRLAVEDPFSTKRNLTRSVSHSELFEYIQDCVRSAYKYFAIPQLRSGPLITKVEMRVDTSSASNSSHGNAGQPSSGNDCGTSLKDITRSSDGRDSTGESVRDDHLLDENHDSSVFDSGGNPDNGPKVQKSLHKLHVELGVNAGSPSDLGHTVTVKGKNPSDIDKLVALLESKSVPVLLDLQGVTVDLKRLECVERKDLMFELTAMGEEEGPPIVCKICQKKGHLKQNCPEEKLPQLYPLPKMTKPYDNLLTKVLMKILAQYEPSRDEVRCRDDVVYSLERFLKEIYPATHLTLFGSSRNGFGFRNSDLDICMTFDRPTAEGLDYEDIINKVASKIKKHRDFFQVLAITTAKVPIVKFQCRHPRTRDRFEGDISLYNTLAQENTRMLRTYADIDYRVKVLGYVTKVFAKTCDIGDASRGSLSSYAYTLMVLYYLQQCKPPVIPVLQELYDPTKDKPKVLVEDCNVWFYDDLNKLSKVWDGKGKNKQSVAQLWIGLLRFYTEQFNITKDVVCIRQHKPLTRFEKMWNGKCFAIEDPFDLNHNLGAGLSRKMQWFIMKAFINVRNLHGVPVSENDIFSDYRDILDYFFDGELLNDGEYAPNDRGCRVCGKIGHIAKDCAVVKQRKEREQKAKERKEKQQEQQQRSQGKVSRQDEASWRADNNRPRHPQTPPRQAYQRSESTPIPVNSAHTHFRSPPKPTMMTMPTYDNKGQLIFGSPPQALLGSPPLQLQMVMQPRPGDHNRPPILPTPQVMQQVPQPHHGPNSSSQAPSLLSNSPQTHDNKATRQQPLYQQQHSQHQLLQQQQHHQQLQQQQQHRQYQQQHQHQVPGQYSSSPSRHGYYASPPRQALYSTSPHAQTHQTSGQQLPYRMTVYDEAQFQNALSSGSVLGVSPQNRSPPNIQVSVSSPGQRSVTEVKGQGYAGNSRGSRNS